MKDSIYGADKEDIPGNPLGKELPQELLSTDLLQDAY